MRSTFPLTLALALAAGGLLGPAAVPAAAQAPAPSAPAKKPAKHEHSIAMYRSRAKSFQQDLNEFVGSIDRLMAYARDDVPKLKAAADRYVALCERIAAAYERDAEDEVKTLSAEAEQAHKDATTWRTRIWEYRRRQTDAAPDEAWYHERFKWQTRERDVAATNAVVRAKQAAADAWGKVAEATVPGADADVIEGLKDKAYVADADAEIADMELKWVSQLDYTWPNPAITSDAVKAKYDALRKVQQERVAMRREEIARERRARELAAQMQAVSNELREAYTEAQREHERAKERERQRQRELERERQKQGK